MEPPNERCAVQSLDEICRLTSNKLSENLGRRLFFCYLGLTGGTCDGTVATSDPGTTTNAKNVSEF